MDSAPKNALGKRKELRLLTFLLAFATATVMFVPFIIKGQGYFIFYGDFNVQQIPFYQYCHQMVRQGNFFWSWETDLGANFIGSYSFYLLGSPFFWLTLLFPNSFVPYLMGPLLILKFSCAALTAYLYIRRFTARPETAMIGGLLYAFSGFSVYNIFFNHFHEAIVFFPLLLLALEMFISEKRRGFLAVAVFISALSNYFFFFGMVVFVVIYWFVRLISKSFKFKFTEFLLMLLECVIGLAMATAILLPAVLAIIENSRVSSFMSGWGAVLYGKEQIFLNVIECFFFPPDIPARPIFFPGADVKWASLGGWLPLFGMTGVITWLKAEKKGSWLRRILVIMTFMALVPGLNSAFYMFNTAYYARWFYMPILMMCLATALSIEDTKVDWHSAWRWNTAIVIGFILVIGFMPNDVINGKVVTWGIYNNPDTNPIKLAYQLFVKAFINKNQQIDGGYTDLRFWVTCLISLLSLVIMRMIFPVIKEKRVSVFKPAVACVCMVSVIYSAFFIGCGQSHSYEIKDVMIDELIEGEVKLDISDEDFARIDVLDGVDNTGLYLGYDSINFFHSIVPASVMDFYGYVGVSRSVASRPETDNYALRPLLSVKYLLDPDIDNSSDFAEDADCSMPGWSLYGEQNGYTIYKNDCYIPMGFTYDYYITEDQASYYGSGKAANMMLKGMLLDGDTAPILQKYLKNITADYYFDSYEVGKRCVDTSETQYKRDCADRAASAGSSFSVFADGFVSKIKLDRENAVFYSVPYDKGWTATVNGEKANIYRVNKGFMAVIAPAGENEIVFTYRTPGLYYGIIISIGAFAVFIIYMIFAAIFRRKRKNISECYPEGDRIAEHIEKYEQAVFNAEHPENEDLLDDIDRDSIDAYVGFSGGFKIDDSVLDDIRSSRDDDGSDDADAYYQGD